MGPTFLIFVFVAALISFLIFVSFKIKISKLAVNLTTIMGTTIIILFVFNAGIDNVKTDVYRLIRNSIPKEPGDVYYVLFEQTKYGCVKVVISKIKLFPELTVVYGWNYKFVLGS